MARSALGYGTRAVLFAAFAWYLYSVRYAPYRMAPFEEVEPAVRAVNAGYPFQLLYPRTDGFPPTVMKMTELHLDYGIHFFVVAIGSAGRAVYGPSFQVHSSVARLAVLLLFVGTAAVMVMTPVPLLIGTAGVLSLWALFAWGPLGLSDARYWGVTYVAVVGMVYLATAVKPWTRPRIAVLGILAALAGYAQVLRQEAGPTSYVAGVALLASAIMAWSAARGSARSDGARSELRSIVPRAAAGGLLLILVNAAVLPFERWCLSRAWRTPFAETQVAVHGDGWPLYLSLGYVSNPYNIGWRDPIGALHARLINPSIKLDTDPVFQPTLLREFERIVISRPWLLLKNIAAKAARVHQLANEPSGERTGTIVTQPPQLVAIYRAMPWVMLASLMVLAWRGTAEGVVVWFASAALALGASAGPLIVFPEYLGGLQGSTVALVLIVPAVVGGSLFVGRGDESTGPQAARRLITAYGALIATGLIVGAAFVSVQALRHRRLLAQVAAGDPVASLREQQFRYAHVFNDLRPTQQGRIIAQLQASTDGSVARHIDERRGDFEIFAPQVLVRTASEIHLFAWMGTGFVPPVPRLFQGSTHVSLLICGSCPAATSINDVQLPMKWTMINDLEWQGRYRMFSVPISGSLMTAPFLRVAAERTRALDTSVPTWMVPELISSVRVSF